MTEDSVGQVLPANDSPRRSLYLEVRRTKPGLAPRRLRRTGHGGQLRPPDAQHLGDAVADADEQRLRAGAREGDGPSAPIGRFRDGVGGQARPGPDVPAEAVLRRTKDGSEVRVLEKTDASELLKTGWKFAEPFQGKAADGTTDLYGLIWRPSNFDPAKKYPIVEFVYTGPQWFFVPKNFAGTLGLQSMAELGFVVVMVDGRGTAGRSRAFHQFSYRNLGGSFEDHVAMIKQMAERYPYLDATRVGVFGTSAGGYGAAHAMLAFPEFYKVGVSTSGDHDARLDKAWWNEAYQGYPVQDDYAAQSNVTMAARLEGHLLLEHGDIDDNVHPVETIRFVDALMKANKNFDMLFVPNMFHGESGEHALYLVRRRWDYFVQYLLGVTPPANFEIKEDRDSLGTRRRRR